MSDSSRKVKNPLLSAAGVGFPFENFTENAMLMPVTPATPAVLPDEGETDTFVGQESSRTGPQLRTTAEIPTIPVDQQQRYTASAIAFPTAEEPRESAFQPQKQGYLSSILSSLPNLSLSTITGDSSAPPGQKTQNIPTSFPGNQQDSNPYYSQPQDSRGPAPGYLPSQTFSASDPYVPQTQGPPGYGESGIAPGQIAPPSQLPPVTLPPAGGPTSYRLGNQRRLKYAPPPDLTTNAPKQYHAPSLQPFPQQNFPSPTTFLDPNATQVQHGSTTQSYTPSAPSLSGNPSPAQGSSLRDSLRSTPVSVGLVTDRPPIVQSHAQNQNAFPRSVPVPPGSSSSSSTPRDIPARFPETATPQNTPATVPFHGFPSYSTPHGDPLASNPGFFVSSDRNSAFATTSSAGTTYQVLNFVNPSGSELVKDSIIEPGYSGQLEDTTSASGHSGSSAFTPILAAKVSEKLEHLLTEQKKESASPKSPDFSSEVDEITSKIISSEVTSHKRHIAPELSVRAESEDKCTDSLAEIDLTKNESLADVLLTEESGRPQESLELSSLPTDRVAVSHSFDASPSRQTVEAPAVVQSVPIYEPFLQTPSKESIESSRDSDFPAAPPPVQPTVSNYFTSTEGPNAPDFYNPTALSSQSTNSSFPPVFSTTTEPSQERKSQSDSFQAPNFPPRAHHQGSVPNVGFNQSAIAVPPPLWTPHSNNSTIPNPAYGATTSGVAPTFYNPAQFQRDAGHKHFSTTNYSQPEIGSAQTAFSSFGGGRGGGAVQSGFLSSSHNAAGYYAPPTPPMATVVPEPTGLATLSPVQMSINPLGGRSTPDTVPPSLQNLAAGSTERVMQYRPVYHHWFHRKEVESKVLWFPFSMQDSLNLEEIHNSNDITPETTVATDGGRYDVEILKRRRTPVYWSGPASEVRRCSWFYKGPSESRYIPYEESTAAKLEEEYKQACLSDNWNRRVELSNGEYIAFHSSTVQVHYVQASSSELAASWGNGSGSEDSTYLQNAAIRPCVVKRGVDEFNIDEGEPEKVDHLLFLVHGIGSVCDLKFRTVEEVVDEFRSISLQLVQSHYRTSSERGIVNRIEVLPISWHATLHSEDTGIDKKLQAITLESIPKLRHFTNDTLLDILFYTSPIYCQTIMETVGGEMNRLYALFKERNPDFNGGVYLGGHSLGSLIIFDLLCHQKPPKEETPDEVIEEEPTDEDGLAPIKPLRASALKRQLSRRVSYVMGAAGTGQPFINYPQLTFHPKAFFALGSPIGMFVTVRGIDNLGEDFALPTCPAFFNVFHPFDPVAYRVEALIDSEASKFRPMLIPHHKGRKRMHLELKETMARVGADLKQKLLDSMRSTWNSVYQLAMFHKPDNQDLEREIDKVVEEQLITDTTSIPESQVADDGGADLKVGKLNGGRRIDYVLQEAPFEYINEYIFALTSHVCYWESEDTMLMMLKEIYGSMGIQTDTQLPQQTMTIERVSQSSPPNVNPSTSSPTVPVEVAPPRCVGVDPTAPISSKPVGAPPISGFVRKS